MAKDKTEEIGYVVTLDSIVRSALMDINEDMSRYEQFLFWAQDGYRQLQFTVDRQIKTIAASVTNYKAIKMPKDYLEYVKIGIKNGDVLMLFTKAHNIMYQVDCGDVESAEVRTEEQDILFRGGFAGLDYGQSIYTDNFITEWGEHRGRLWGVVAKHNGTGYFRVNERKREIQLETSLLGGTTQKVYMEYVAACIEPGKTTIVHPTYDRLLRYYIHWQRLENNDKVGPNKAARAEDLYWREFERVRFIRYDWSIDEIIEASKDSFHMVKY